MGSLPNRRLSGAICSVLRFSEEILPRYCQATVGKAKRHRRKGEIGRSKSTDRIRPLMAEVFFLLRTILVSITLLRSPTFCILICFVMELLLLTVSTSALITRPARGGEVGEKGEGRNPVRNQSGQQPVWRELNRLKLRKH
jgi:hypothetical protein